MNDFRAGAASLPLGPPLGLPMVGFVRQPSNARGYGLPLEVGALALECGDTRVLLCGVDVVGIIHPQIEPLIERIAAATGAAPPGILLNLSHTHLAPPGGVAKGAVYGDVDDDVAESIASFSRVIHDKIVSVCELAMERLEPARVVWGQAEVDLAVNRRERTTGGYNGGSILGWNPDELVDNQVTVLQARREDESAIGTVVGYGCHPVTTGYDMVIYSADFPGPMRDVVRGATGGECIYFQGAAGNVLPKFAFTDSEDEARRMGTRLAIAALDAVADRYSRPVEVVAEEEGSVTPITRYRRLFVETVSPALSAACETVSIPLLPHPELTEIEEQRAAYEAELDAARASGDRGKVKLAYYQASWARTVEAQLRDGTAPTEVRGPVHAVRIGDGVIVTGPGETFTEYGIAVKERSPGAPTLYAGYTNEIIGYLPTANEYQYGGYEAGYGYKSVGLPSLFDPSVEQICVETGVRLAERLFPEAEPWDAAQGWTARGNAPTLAPTPLVHPSRTVSGVAGP
jgi:neutral ceramidase